MKQFYQIIKYSEIDGTYAYVGSDFHKSMADVWETIDFDIANYRNCAWISYTKDGIQTVGVYDNNNPIMWLGFYYIIPYKMS